MQRKSRGMNKQQRHYGLYIGVLLNSKEITLSCVHTGLYCGLCVDFEMVFLNYKVRIMFENCLLYFKIKLCLN